MKQRWLKYVIVLLLGAALVCAILFWEDYFSFETLQDRLRVLSDAFLVPGLLLVLSGCFLWILRQGTFAGMGYTARKIWNSLHSQEYRENHKESYAEYCERKSAKKTPFLFLILTGAVFLVPAIILTIVYLLI